MGTIWAPDLTQFDGPKYLALADALRAAIRHGTLAEGDRLPPVRDLAWRLGITPGTVARAYQIATQEGLLEASVGRGTYVAANAPSFGPTVPLFAERPADTARAQTGAVDLRSPQLPDAGQVAALAAILRDMAGQVAQDWLEYPGLRRDRPLREAFADYLSDRALGPIDADDLALAHGGQNAIGIVLQCCLRGDRPQIFCEELAYPGFRHAARLNRAEVVPVAIDGWGMRADALDAACRRHGARIVCLTTEAQNPTAARMPAERREDILRVARRHDLQIIEDDCYSIVPSRDPSLRAMAPERCWYVTSLSKSISAGLRFGGIVCPEGRGESARLAAQHSYFGLSRPVTEIVGRLLASGRAQALRGRVHEIMSERLEQTVTALKGYDVAWREGLSFVWLRLPQGWRGSTFVREAESAGVLIRSADEYALIDGHAPNAVRIALSGSETDARFKVALGTLARLLANPPGELPV